MKGIMLISITAVALMVSTAHSRERTGSCLAGMYIGGGLTYATFVGNDMEGFSDAVGFVFKFGRKFERLALELKLRHDNAHKQNGVSGEFNGFLLDAKWFLSDAGAKQQLYALGGLGQYWFHFEGTDDSFRGVGVNLGGGVEHYFEERMSLSADLVYTILKYNRFKTGDVTTDLDPSLSGDAVTANVALNLYF